MSDFRTFGQYGSVPKRVTFTENFGYDIVAYGRNNTYPQEVEYAIARSGIATACLKVFSEFLYGNGFASGGNTIVNESGDTLNDILLRACQDFAQFAGLGLRLNFNANAKYTSIENEYFTHIRLAKPYADENIITCAKVSDDWAGESWRNASTPSTAVEVDLFDPSELDMEVEEMEGHNGQLLYATMANNFYSKSFFDSVIEQILTSGDLSEFDRRYIQNGFSASQVFVNRSESPSADSFDNNSRELSKFGGIRSAGGIFYMEGDIDVLDMSKGQKMTEQYNALREGLKDDIQEALSIPPVLLGRTRQGGFPNQDEIINAFQYYNGMIDQYRQFIARQFDRINAHYFVPLIPVGTKFDILPKTFAGAQTPTQASV